MTADAAKAMKARTFSPGFRLSPLDVVILAGGVAGAVFVPKEIAIVAATAVGHFFLFCNVFRMSRKPELIWAATFTTLAATTLFHGAPGWTATVSISFCLALALIALETRKPSYHGLGWRRLNPGLPDWWAAHPAGKPGA
jgi:hypothetical protein